MAYHITKTLIITKMLIKLASQILGYMNELLPSAERVHLIWKLEKAFNPISGVQKLKLGIKP